MGNVLVSVYCLAYNHEKYIRDALEGFIMQKTTFPFEVFVHDDASTDHTAEIIREYAKKYPDIIKPIFQHENQYSKGISISRTYIYPKMKGKYIAICEGDDYWCDENKLQKQVDFLDNHPDYSACVHNSLVVNCRTGRKGSMNSNNKKDCTLDFEGLLLRKSDSVFQTSSLMYRSEYLFLPDAFRSRLGVGDYPKLIYLAISGKIYYYHDKMSVYRRFTQNSWTSNNFFSEDRKKKKILIYQGLIQMINEINSYTSGKYHSIFNKAIREQEFSILKENRDYRTLFKNYKDIYKQKPFKARAIIMIDRYFPFVKTLYCNLLSCKFLCK